MKIQEIIENNDNKTLTEVSGYAILSLINKRIYHKQLNDKNTIDEFFYDYDFDIDYDKYIEIANNFIKNNLDGYNPDLDDTIEIKVIK